MKLKYTVRRDSSSHQYHHIHLSIYTLASLDRSCPHPVLSIQWQGDNQNIGWYAFRAESTCDNSREGSESFAIAASIMRKLTKADDASDFSRDNPGKVIEAIGAERVVNDARVNSYIAPEMAAPESWQRYMALDGQQCVISVCAPDEETASKMLFAQFAEYADKGGQYRSASYYQRQLEAWILAGKPIGVDCYAKAPDVRPLDEILKPMREPEPAQVEAAA